MFKIIISSLVASHLIAAIWHGESHTALSIHLPLVKDLFIYVVVLVMPFIGAILIWTRFALWGMVGLALAMLGALIFGVYHHYILVSPDHVAHLPSGPPEAHSHFIWSAALIAILELVSALYGGFAIKRFQSQN